MWFKEVYAERTKESPTPLTLFFNDFTIIENHFATEFRRFNFIGVLLLCFIFYSFGLFFNNAVPFFSPEFPTGFGYCLFSKFFTYILYTIYYYRFLQYKRVLQKCIVCASAALILTNWAKGLLAFLVFMNTRANAHRYPDGTCLPKIYGRKSL